jgi:hypothetical protein
LVAAWFAASLLANAGEPLKLVHTIPLQGVKGRFDHFAYDASAHRLIVAALGNNTAEIFDVAQFKWLHTIAGLHKPTGALLLPEPNRVYLANGNDGTIRALMPTTTMRTISASTPHPSLSTLATVMARLESPIRPRADCRKAFRCRHTRSHFSLKPMAHAFS